MCCIELTEGVFGLIGAVIGGGFALLGTLYATRRNSRTEQKKLALSILNEKKAVMDSFLRTSCYGDITGDMEESEGAIWDEYRLIDRFIQQKAHYFPDSSRIDNIRSNIFSIENDKDYSPHEKTYQAKGVVIDFHQLISDEMDSTMKSINKMIELHKYL